jgi:hypothetical protein
MVRTPDHVQTSVHAVSAPTVSVSRQVGHFVRHYVEMCVPMCIGFAVGDLVYFAIAERFGYSQPFSDLPVLSVVVVTFTMTAPMVAWMRFRGMRGRPVVEMAAVMPILAGLLLMLGWLGVLEMGDLALIEHGLMMPAMLIPMLLRLDVYTGRASYTAA